MKKEQKNKKLTLGKMTVAKLTLSQQQMRNLMGGNDTNFWLGKTTVEVGDETNCSRTTTKTTATAGSTAP
jgi:natural product precursor